MAAKVKHPVRAALARFLPIKNHLNNIWDYLGQAGRTDFNDRILALSVQLRELEKDISALREK